MFRCGNSKTTFEQNDAVRDNFEWNWIKKCLFQNIGLPVLMIIYIHHKIFGLAKETLKLEPDR